jgi:AcrR family transcriptional regulator
MPHPRENQRYRTRKDLLQAAARLLREGRSPSVGEVADAARISRATAYRYFPSRDALLAEAPLDGELPTPQALFANDVTADPVERLDRAEAAMHRVTFANATRYRLMLARLLEHDGKRDGDEPVRQNRRTDLIDAALAPSRRRFRPASHARLRAALALVFGTESMIVFRDVLRLEPDAARAVKRWVIETLVAAALAESSGAERSDARSRPTPATAAAPAGRPVARRRRTRSRRRR